MTHPNAPAPADPGREPTAPLPATALDDWFVAAVLPLEPALMQLLRRHCRQADELPDLRQDIYVRVYEAAARGGLPAHTAAFMFTCARHLLVDRARRAQVVSIESVAELEALPGLPQDDFTPERHAAARGALRLLQTVLDALPPRCRDVVVLRKIEGLSQKEIAQRMGIAEGTVEKHITVGVRALANGLLAHGLEPTGAACAGRQRRPAPDA